MATLAFFFLLMWMRRKIYGNYDEELFDYAVNEYCSMNHRQVVKPYINKRDDKGKKMYSLLSKAIHAAKAVFREKLLPIIHKNSPLPYMDRWQD